MDFLATIVKYGWSSSYSMLDVCINAVCGGGDAAVNGIPRSVEVKDDAYVGHHSVVTNVDYLSQAAILDSISMVDRDSLFITEEHVESEEFRKRIVRPDELERMRDSGVYIIDELDGTSSRAINHYEWSVSVGYVKSLEHVAGAVYAPAIYGGALFYASQKRGAFLRKGNKNIGPLSVIDREIKGSYVVFGPDCPLSKYPYHNKLMKDIADAVRTVNINGSCALPMGMIAAGSADCLVEPLVCPWDWAAGKLIAEEAGGKVVFYEMPDGKPTPIKQLELKHYNPSERMVGLIAGNERIVDFVSELFFRESKA